MLIKSFAHSEGHIGSQDRTDDITSYSECCSAELVFCKDCKELKCSCQYALSCITAKLSTPMRGFCRSCWRVRCEPAGRKQNWKLRGIDNFTEVDYLRFYKEQNGKCAICFAPPGDQLFDVDHDHKTGIVRGLLCRDCNFMLGKAKDDSEVLKRASEYVANGGVI